MAYHISISGQHHLSTEEEARAWEEELAGKVREFVASLEGVQAASGSFGFISSQDLTADTPPEAAIPEPAKPEATGKQSGAS